MNVNTPEEIRARLVGHGGIEPHNVVRPRPLTRQQIESAVSIAIQNEATK